MEGSREEVMRFVLQVVAEFQTPDERTQAAKIQRDHENDQANLRHIDALYTRQRTPAPLSTHVSKQATSVARMNDGTAGGSARRHNGD